MVTVSFHNQMVLIRFRLKCFFECYPDYSSFLEVYTTPDSEVTYQVLYINTSMGFNQIDCFQFQKVTSIPFVKDLLKFYPLIDDNEDTPTTQIMDISVYGKYWFISKDIVGGPRDG